MSRVVPVLAFVLALAPAPAPAAPSHPAGDVVRTFFTAYAAGDVETARATWAAEQQQRFRRLMERTIRVRCMRVERFQLRELAASADSASYLVDAEVVSTSAMPGDRGRAERMLIEFVVTRYGEAWKITDRREPEMEVAQALVDGAPVYETVQDAVDRGARVRLIVRNLTRIGVDFRNRGRPAEGLPVVEMALAVATEYGDDDAISEALGARSIYAATEPETARGLAQLALVHAEKNGNPDVIARALLRLGRVDAHREVTPIEPYTRMVAMGDFVESAVTLANATLHLSDHYRNTGRYRDALHYATASLHYGRDVGERTSILSSYLALGALYSAHGDAEMAARYYDESARMVQELDLSSAAAPTLASLVQAYSDAGDVAEAFAAVQTALAQTGAAEHATLLLSRSQLYLLSGHAECARDDARAVVTARELPAWQLPQAWAVLSRAAWRLGRYEEALEEAEIAIALVEGPSELAGRIEKAIALRSLGRLDEAAASLRSTVEQIERRRLTAIPDARQLQMYTKATAAAYVELTDVLSEAGRIDEAAEVIARLHGRALRDLQDRDARPRTRAEDPELESVQGRLREMNRRILTAKHVDAEVTRELTAARLDLDDLHARRSLQSTLSEPREIGPSLPLGPELAIIEYVVARERVLAFVRRGGTIEVFVIPAAPVVLAEQVARFVRSIESRDLAFRAESRGLYDVLIAPLERATAGTRYVCIIPDGELWSVPFHALTVPGGQYYADRVTLFYAPSMHFLVARRHETSSPRVDLLAFANAEVDPGAKAEVRALFRNAPIGPLPDAETEVRQLARMYGPESSRIYVGPEASEATFKREGGRTRILHIATHGLVDPRSPMYSSVLLSASGADGEDGVLEAREIAEMQLGADLAVLSACDTGRGGFSVGEGVIGVAWAFLAAGCPTTVVSQWRVDSAATKELMIRFHERLRAGEPAPDALRAAQAALRKNPSYRHPHYWAPFIILGAGNVLRQHR